MSKLSDIAPVTKPFDLNGVTVTITGLSIAAFVDVLNSNEQLAELVQGGASFVQVVSAFPGPVAKLIAAGTGSPGDEAEIAAALALTAGHQVLLLEEIVNVSFAGDVVPFVQKLLRLAAITNGKATPAPSTATPAAPAA
jgi:hypothetical protein